MQRRLILAGLGATGGLVAAAFLQAAVAMADTADVDPSASGADAFTIGGYTFDPFTVSSTGADVEGFATVPELSSAPPLLELGGGTALGVIQLAPQSFDVYSPSTGDALGSIDANESVTNLLGLTNTEFTVLDSTPASGDSAANLPSTGSVYDVFNLGNGYANVYTDVVGSGSSGDTVTDTLVTPYGDENLSSLFGDVDAAAPLQPGDAFTGLVDNSVGTDAFTIGSTTFDPFTVSSAGADVEGFAPVSSFASAPPLLNIGGGILLGSTPLASQDFNVYDGTGASAPDVGTINTGVDVTNLLGLTNTEFTVLSATAASGDTTAEAAALPATGTVYDALNLGNGWENVYTATPDVGSTSGTVTDTLVTPYGNVNLDSLFGSINAANPLQPGDAFTGLETADITGAPDAFTIDGTTFDPFTVDSAGADVEGFTPVPTLLGSGPLLNISVGEIQKNGTQPLTLATQGFDVYSGTGSSATDVGSVDTSEDVTNLLGLTNTEFTVTSVAAAAGDTTAEAAALPTVGSVYDVFNIGDGIENVYTAIPGVSGAANTVTDTLVTPWGDFNLDSLFGGIDAAAQLDPGAAFSAGLDVASAATSTVDPLAFLGL